MPEGGWGPAGTGEPAPRDDNHGNPVSSKIIIAVLAVVAVVAVIAAGALWVGFGRDSSPAANPAASPAESPADVPATTAEVQLERTSSAGDSPFMSPVGQDQPNVTAPANIGGEFLGSTPGLFADTGDKPSCDTQTLIANLDADAAKATAWATALGLQSKDIPAYVTGLTPVVLRSDTAVTSYGYADGRFFAYPAVLQAGTAVFVNSYGEPKAKCFSGNPLTQPASIPKANYVGPAWEQFAPKSVTTIQRPPTVIVNYIFVDVRKGTTVHRPAKPPKKDDSNWHCKNNFRSDQCGGMRGKATGKEKPVDNGKKMHEGGPVDKRQDGDQQGRDQQGRDQQGRDQQGRDQQGRDQQGRDQQGR